MWYFQAMLGEQEAVSIAHGLRNNSTITSLDLSDSSITPDAAGVLASNLGTNAVPVNDQNSTCDENEAARPCVKSIHNMSEFQVNAPLFFALYNTKSQSLCLKQVLV